MNGMGASGWLWKKGGETGAGAGIGANGPTAGARYLAVLWCWPGKQGLGRASVSVAGAVLARDRLPLSLPAPARLH
jgi:hypothetical protein